MKSVSVLAVNGITFISFHNNSSSIGVKCFKNNASTLDEGRLMWDSDKLKDFNNGRTYNAGDAWFSSTDGVHDSVSYVHFPYMNFKVYAELGRLLNEYYDT